MSKLHVGIVTPILPKVAAATGSCRLAPGEQRFVMEGIDWPTFTKIAEALAERHFRLSFDGWSLELMTTSSTHGTCSRLLAFLLAILIRETGQSRRCCGDMTCSREDIERGLQPDECFYIVNAPRVLGRDRLDLNIDPPPDLAIEVDLTTDARRRLGIYAALGVPEVWRFDGDTVIIHGLAADGQYAIVEQSRYFSFLAGGDLARFLALRNQVDENILEDQFRTWVRQQISGKPS